MLNMSSQNSSQNPNDGVGSLYNQVNQWSIGASFAFWTSLVVSMLSLVLEKHQLNQAFNNLATTICILSSAIYGLISYHIRLNLFPQAEQVRRKLLLSDSFGVALLPEKTVNYYNNPCPSSVARLGLNAMESAFFTSTICSSMYKRAMLKSGLCVITLVLACLNRDTPLSVISWVFQGVMSVYVIGRFKHIGFLLKESKEVYEQLYTVYTNKIFLYSPEGRVSLIEAFGKYEAAKAYAGICLNTDDYDRLNPSLTVQWEHIVTTLELSPAVE